MNLALKTSPNRLDPALVVDVGEGEICSLLYEGLIRFSTDGEVVPALASHWEVNGAATRYVFHLDSKRRFSDGTRVSAGHVVSSFERVLSPETQSSRRWVLDRIRGAGRFARGEAEAIEGLDAVDDSTVAIELAEPFAPFLSLLALPAAMVVNDESTAPRPVPVPVGSGAWQLVAWDRGDFLSLTRNPYHPNPNAGIGEIRYRIIPEAFTRIAEFESGALDVLEVPVAEVPRYLSDAAYAGQIQSRPELRVYYIGLNNRNPRLADVRVRRALNLAVDVDQLIAVLSGGQGQRATGSIPPTLPGYRPRDGYGYDPAQARRLLAEAGFQDDLELEIWQRESPEGNRMLEAVQGYLSAVGVSARMVRREWSAFKEAVSAGRVDAFLLDWYGDYPDAENFLYPLFHSRNHGGGGNRAFFSDAAVDSMIELAARTVNRDERATLYAEVDSLVYAQAPWIYLFFPTSVYVVSERVSGYHLPALYLANDFTTIRKEPR